MNVEDDDGLFHYHGHLIALGHPVQIESVGGTFSGPGRSLGHLFIFVDGELSGYGCWVGCSLGFGGNQPARAAIGNATLVVEHTRGPVTLYRARADA